MRLLIVFLLLTTPLYAASPDRRICDQDGDCADISNGKLRVSSTNEGFTTTRTPSPIDRRISDNDGQVADITASGALRIS